MDDRQKPCTCTNYCIGSHKLEEAGDAGRFCREAEPEAFDEYLALTDNAPVTHTADGIALAGVDLAEVESRVLVEKALMISTPKGTLAPVTVDFAELEVRVMATLGVDPDRAKFCWLGAVLPTVDKRHVSIFKNPVANTGRVELYVFIPRSLWEMHNIWGIDHGEASGAALPPEIASMEYGDERIGAVKAWHKRLHAACYAEIFCKYPQIYDKLMQEVCLHKGIKDTSAGRGYPVLWSNDFVRLIGDGVLGSIEVDGLMEMGYITVPKEWFNDER